MRQRLAKQGMSAARIASELDDAKGRIRLVALLDTLSILQGWTHLQNGGVRRRRAVHRFRGRHPDGAVAVFRAKARGLKKGNNPLIQQVKEAGGIDSRHAVLPGLYRLRDDLVRKYADSQPRAGVEGHGKRRYSTVGGTIGTHVGPGAVALVFR